MSEWIEWKGGEIPVDPETKVEVRFSDDDTDIQLANRICWTWNLDDIIAYRVVNEKEAC